MVDRERRSPEDRLLAPDEWRRLRAARLEALADAPDVLLPGRPPESTWSEQRWRLSWRAARWAVAETGDETVGLARLSWTETGAYIESVWTRRDHRQRGVASAMVRRLITEHPADRGEIFVWVAQPNDAAMRLYTSLGFRSTKVTQWLAALNRVEEQLRFNGGHPRD
ncbi:putative GCN5-related N-acetyltransferase [Actinoplanes missouriensis 431]|uniref:Putative GCN5-related N-acetyltransferase n=1 Tax=Actinoplanes missouriensis (strain ATCC 14538 / DSM 43046 / CBS 188.64 / JCM 3121 / NBRC 102363 / NCIMB 12654 / NRRL B-3342 / UNCC 431) TaxID=512565 RepID=I0H5W8_ACTM4|nr:GNAT family N-acetyltransferase [Actinoplanes missouriensis]BAL88405.1 putative GCN5-related N-acetyltransferase [Actinoplanes missouriensis 431]